MHLTLIAERFVGSVVFSLNGKRIISWGDTILIIWDAQSGDQLQTLNANPGMTGKTFFSRDGNMLAWLTNGKITLVNLVSGEKPRTLESNVSYSAATFDNNASTMASWNDTNLTLWDVTSGNQIRTVSPDMSLSSVAFFPDRTTIVAWNLTKIRAWNITSGQELNSLEGSDFSNVICSPDGHTLTFAYGIWNDATIFLWDVDSGGEPFKLKEHESTFTETIFSPDGRTIVVGRPTELTWSLGQVALDKLSLFDVTTRQELQTLSGSSNLTFSPSRKTAVSWLVGGKFIKMWDSTNWHEIQTMQVDFSIGFIGFSPDGKRFISWNDHAITVWDAESGKELHKLKGSVEPFPFFVFSKDGKTLASVTSRNTTLWDLESTQSHPLNQNAFLAKSFAVSPNGKQLATWIDGSVVKLWDLGSGQGPRTFSFKEGTESSVVFSPDGKTIAFFPGAENKIDLRDLATGTTFQTLDAGSEAPSKVVFSPDGKKVAAAIGTIIAIWDVTSGQRLRVLHGYAWPVLVFSPDGRMIGSVGADYAIKIWNLESGLEIKASERHSNYISAIAFSPVDNMVASASWDQTIKLWDTTTGKLITTLRGHRGGVSSVAFSSDGKVIASGSWVNGENWDNTIRFWDVLGRPLKVLQSADAKTLSEVASVVPDLYKDYYFSISPHGHFQVSLGENGRVNLFDVKSGAPLVTLFALGEEEWAVTTPEGRFDTNKSLDRIAGLHWVVNGEIRNPLPLDIFMRQYYEPGLLRRALRGEQFQPLPSIAHINRVQPRVNITNIKPAVKDPDSVEVTVDVESATEAVSISATDPAKKKRFSSGVFDLRLFRDGQLVGYSTNDEKLQTTFRTYQNFNDELAVWREANKVELVEGRKTFTFTVKLPAVQSTNSANRQVEFSAYAFNEDRVKSNTATSSWVLNETAKAQLERSRVKPRAYVISVGVNANENPAFDLQFAANDARRFQEVLSQRLSATGEYSEVVPVSLISDWEERGGEKVTTRREATKANFKAVIDLLAGRSVSDEIKRAIPNAGKLLKSTPDELVMILFSSHGYADQSGNFYFIPYDTGPVACSFTETVRQRSISSDELSLWLRDVDAGQMTLIVDACYSTAAIEGSGFKPGPMGSRGLGQLAYDKRMRILTATQADNVAMELPAGANGRLIEHGLLSYALLEDGLGANKADFKPQDKTIFMDEWLEYAVADVPKLFADQPRPRNETQVASRQRNNLPRLVLLKRQLADPDACGPRPSVGPVRTREQQPSLFDFTRRKREVALVRNP